MLCVLLPGKKQGEMDMESTETKRGETDREKPEVDGLDETDKWKDGYDQIRQRRIKTEEMCPVPQIVEQ